MALAGLLKVSLLGSYAPKLEANGVTLYDLRSIPEENRKAIEDIGLSVGMGKADLKKFKKIHEKLHLQIHSFHFKKGKRGWHERTFPHCACGQSWLSKDISFQRIDRPYI